MPGREDDDRKRDASIHNATPGHWWTGYEQKPVVVSELDPSKLNLNNVQHFLRFLAAINRGEKKSVTFLNRMPAARKEQLKKTHEALGAQLLALG